MIPLTLAMLTLDSSAPDPIARWWAERFGADVEDPFDGSFLIVHGGSLPLRLTFQQVPDPTPGKNLLHLDLVAPDLDAAVAELVGTGASLVERRGDEHFRWVTLTDPDGHQFCLASGGEAEESALA